MNQVVGLRSTDDDRIQTSTEEQMSKSDMALKKNFRKPNVFEKFMLF